MEKRTRNPYVVLGIPFGASRDVATVAFAKRAKALRRAPDGAERLTDLTWALNQIDEVIRDPSLALHVYRVPADHSALEPDGEGVLAPPPELLGRRTESGPEDHDEMRRRAGREMLTALAREVAGVTALPRR